MRYVAIILAVGTAAFLAAGCMDYSQKIVVHEDGSATVTIDSWLDEVLTGLAEEIIVEDGFSGNILLYEFENKPGIEILDSFVEIDEKTGLERHHVEFNVESSKVLEDLPSFGKSGSAKWETNGDGVSFERILRNDDAIKEYENAEDEESMRSLFEGYTWTYEVVMPGPVTETNGTVGADGRTATWSWSLFDITLLEEIVMTAKCEL
jgi:hypothetical protein